MTSVRSRCDPPAEGQGKFSTHRCRIDERGPGGLPPGPRSFRKPRAALVRRALAVTLDHDHRVLRVQPDVDRGPVGLGDLHLVRGSVLGVGLAAVGGATSARLDRGPARVALAMTGAAWIPARAPVLRMKLLHSAESVTGPAPARQLLMPP